MSGSPDPRARQVAEGLEATLARIAGACAAAGRPEGSVALVVVTKTFPAIDVAILAGLGVRDVGENRDQEARAKRAELEGALAGVPLRWHMIGQLQRNKARSVARWADVVESVDRLPLAEALAGAAVEAGRELEALVQVSLDGSTGRGGARPADALALCDAVAALPGLRLGGLMAVAPYPGGPGDPGAAFARLAALHAEVTARHPGATTLSAGMSGDLEEAIAHGATQVRVGGAILGSRPAFP